MRSLQAALLLALSASPALAQRAPVIVVPGRPGVPVLMNGVDVSWSVIEGEFGLDRPGEVTPTVIYRPFAVPVPYHYGPTAGERGEAGGYFPKAGQRPGYGRLEIVPPPDRPLPPPAPSYRRSWSSQSDSSPATEYTPFAPPADGMWGGRYGRQQGRGAQQIPGKGAAPGPGEGTPQDPGHDPSHDPGHAGK